MKIKASTVVALLLGIFLLHPMTSEAYPNEKNGFRGLEWGTRYETVKDQFDEFRCLDDTEVIRDEAGKYVRTDIIGKNTKRWRKTELMMLGSARIWCDGDFPQVTYTFRQGQLTKVEIQFVTDAANADAALSTLVENFGPGEAKVIKTYQAKGVFYYWNGETTTMIFRRYAETETSPIVYSNLTIFSTKLHDLARLELEKKQDQDKRAIERKAEF